MILISHRGNTNGRTESWENEPTYIDLAISKGYDVEVDVWYVDNILYLGHDKPQYGIDFRWFRDRITKLWVHCKNIESLIFFRNLQYEFNYFWHETDTVTLTSLNFVWAYPGKQPIEKSIAVMPEINNDDLTVCIGVCSDNISSIIV
jgi:hypothetical protein